MTNEEPPVPDNSPSGTSSSTPTPWLASALGIVALVIVAGLPLDENLEVFGIGFPAWLVAVVLYVTGFFAGRLSADRPLLRRRSKG